MLLMYHSTCDLSHLQFLFVVFFQAEDGIRDLVRSRGLGDVYKRQVFQSTVHTVGGVVAAGDAIMLIVPAADNLTVEALSLIHI